MIRGGLGLGLAPGVLCVFYENLVGAPTRFHLSEPIQGISCPDRGLHPLRVITWHLRLLKTRPNLGSSVRRRSMITLISSELPPMQCHLNMQQATELPSHRQDSRASCARSNRKRAGLVSPSWMPSSDVMNRSSKQRLVCGFHADLLKCGQVGVQLTFFRSRRRIVSPIAIGRTPPSDLRIAHNLFLFF